MFQILSHLLCHRNKKLKTIVGGYLKGALHGIYPVGYIGKSYTGIVYLNVSSVILYNKLIEARMFPEKYVQGISLLCFTALLTASLVMAMNEYFISFGMVLLMS